MVSPERADVLSAIICRIRGDAGAVPLAVTYDYHERVYGPPMPILFQHRVGLENRQISAPAIRKLLDLALAGAGLTDTAGQPLRLIPHDFRRIFITDAVMNGMPPHIAQLVAGHADINTTMGYKAVYPEEAINGHRAFLARRRALRPTGEYWLPTDQEWEEFLGHFARRKVALGAASGMGASLATTRLVESLLFGLKPNDPLTIGIAALLLLAVAGVAGYLPARRAALVDPMVALRQD